MEIFRVAFIGHRVLSDIRKVEDELEKHIFDLLRSKEYVEFYMGRNGDFDICAASAVKRVQKKMGRENNSLILVLPYSNQDANYLAQFYDEIQYPVSPDTHFKAAVGERNKWMIENCNELVAYVEHSHGGAYTAYQFALKQEKQILNLAENRK